MPFFFRCRRGWEPRDGDFEDPSWSIMTLIATYFSISFNFLFNYLTPTPIYKFLRKTKDCPNGEIVSKLTKEVLEVQPGPVLSLLYNVGKIT